MPDERNVGHVWSADLDDLPIRSHDDQGVLSEEELTVAHGIQGHDRQRRFIAKRSAIRTLIGRYLDADPKALAFQTNAHGKPYLSTPSSGTRFNVSYSGPFILIAIADNRHVGIDVDRPRQTLEPTKIARQFFTAAEISDLEAIPPNERVHAFLRCWTRKEAFVKALGTGFATGLDTFEVPVGEHALTLRSVSWDPAEASRWGLANVTAGLPEECVASVCAEGTDWVMERWHWDS